MLWIMLPGVRVLAPTRVMDVRNVVQTGFINVHTLAGQRHMRHASLHRAGLEKHVSLVNGAATQLVHTR